MRRSFAALIFAALCLVANASWAGGGPLGIDHRLKFDNSGIWNRDVQNALVYGLIATEAIGGTYEGGETRLGRTFWRSIDSSIGAGLTTGVLKRVFSRARPRDSDNPNDFFKGGGNESFPSGEVTAVSSIVTPFVLEYRHDHPWVYGLELLPVYDAIARMKVRAHWQTDVLAAFAIGTTAGKLSQSSERGPLLLSVLPDGFKVGFKKYF